MAIRIIVGLLEFVLTFGAFSFGLFENTGLALLVILLGWPVFSFVVLRYRLYINPYMKGLILGVHSCMLLLALFIIVLALSYVGSIAWLPFLLPAVSLPIFLLFRKGKKTGLLFIAQVVLVATFVVLILELPILLDSPFSRFNPDQCPEINDAPGFRKIVYYPDCTSDSSVFGKEICDHMSFDLYDLFYHNDLNALFVAHAYTPDRKNPGPRRGLSRLTLEDELSFKNLTFPTGESGYLFYDESRDRLIVPLYRGKYIALVNPSTLKEEDRIFERSHRTLFQKGCFLEDNRSLFFCTEDIFPWMFSHDFSSGEERQEQIKLLMPSIYDVEPLPGGQKALVNSIIAPVISEMDLQTFQWRIRKWIFPGSFEMATDHEANELYITRIFLSRVDVLNLRTLKKLRQYSAGFGVRDIELDKKRNLLYASNYLDGSVDVISLVDGERLARFTVGPLPRALYLCPHSGRVFTLSQCGLFEILPDELLVETVGNQGR